MDNLARKMTVIPANASLLPGENMGAASRCLRVAAYCRVSTDDEEQLTSYNNQIQHYTEVISSNENWRMVGVFADEGITGTSAKKRGEFLKLMELCRKGKVDLILTKSISRFSRNTLDSISYVRKLKAAGIGVMFEKENINTLHMSNEVVFTVLSAFAQAESESISENVKWGKRNSIKNGKIPFQYGRLLGYEKGDDGMPKIVPEQAATIRRIYAMFLAGYSIARIKSELEAGGVPSACGRPEWSQSVIRYILSNEKYAGDVLLQKTFVADCISKQVKKNNGEVQQYYVSDNHEAIIPRDIFYKTQEELARRAAKRKVAEKNVKTERGKYSSKYALSELLTCGECGTRYRRVTWARGEKKKVVWRCISRLEYGTKYCKESPTIEEYVLHEAILGAIRQLTINKEELLDTLKDDIQFSLDPSAEQVDRLAAEQKIVELDAQMMDLVTLIGQPSENPSFESFQQIADEKALWVGKLGADEQRRSTAEVTSAQLAQLAAALDAYTLDLTAYDDSLVRRIVDNIRVMGDDKLLVTFRGGIEVEQELRL